MCTLRKKERFSDKQPDTEPEKEGHTKRKIYIRKAKNGMEINEIETKKNNIISMKLISSVFFKNINTSLARLVKKKKGLEVVPVLKEKTLQMIRYKNKGLLETSMNKYGHKNWRTLSIEINSYLFSNIQKFLKYRKHSFLPCLL